MLVHGAMYVVEDVKMQFDEKNRPDYKNGVRAEDMKIQKHFMSNPK